jgi:hypothetical protein
MECSVQQRARRVARSRLVAQRIQNWGTRIVLS